MLATETESPRELKAYLLPSRLFSYRVAEASLSARDCERWERVDDMMTGRKTNIII